MELQNSVRLLENLKSEGGLFIAAPSDSTGYSKAWLRDNIYTSFGMEIVDKDSVIIMLQRLFDMFLKHEEKIDHAIMDKPKHAYQYIHARYHPITLDEFWEEWGNKQNDAVGAFIFRVADMMNKGNVVPRDGNDYRILRKLVAYLGSIEYWQDKDNGVWEEHEELHASSVGACLAGLKAISKYIPVPAHLIIKGQEALDKLLPNESITKETDLALLSLIYPFNIVNDKQRSEILRRLEDNLVRERGVIRYVGDKYYNKNGEAEWTMGLPWLAIIYRKLGSRAKYTYYMKKTFECLNDKGELPELYFSKSETHNDNSPLAWAQSLYMVAAM